jgi:hypothetical protein
VLGVVASEGRFFRGAMAFEVLLDLLSEGVESLPTERDDPLILDIVMFFFLFFLWCY